MVVGRASATRGLSHSTIKEIDGTLALLQATGGGDKEVRKILKEMREVQKHNMNVLEEARQAEKEASKRESAAMEAENRAKAAQDAANESRADLEHATIASREEMTTAHKELDRRKADFEARSKAATEKLKTDMAAMVAQRDAVTLDVERVNKRELALKSLEGALRERLEHLASAGTMMAGEISATQKLIDR